MSKKIFNDLNLRIIFGITLMAVLGVSSIAPVLPDIQQHFMITKQKTALLIAVFTLPGMLFSPLIGILADRLGRRLVVSVALFIFGITGSLCAFIPDFNFLLLMRFLQGTGGAALATLNVTLIGDLFEGNKRSTAMGYNASILSIGTATYPFIGGSLAILGWNYPFLLSALAVPIGLLVLAKIKLPDHRSQENLGKYLINALKQMYRKDIIAIFSLSLLTFIILYGGLVTYFPFYLKQNFNFGSLEIGIALATVSVFTAISSSQLGKLSKRFSNTFILTLAFILYFISLFIIPFINNVIMLIVPMLIFGLAQGINIPNLHSMLAGKAPGSYRAAFMSINGSVLRGGQTLGPAIVGVFYNYWGIHGLFWGCAILALIGILIINLMLQSPVDRKKVKKSDYELPT